MFRQKISSFLLKNNSLKSIFNESSSRNLTLSANNHAKVGFIGLGNMGTPMATHLQKKGHELYVYDANKSAMDNLVSGGAKALSSPIEVVKQVERCFTMVPTPDIVLKIYTGPDGIISHAPKDTILMDSSTVDPSTSKRIEAEAREKGVRFIDTPVTGAVPAAQAGTLTFIVGGPKETVDEVRDLLLCMGKNVIHCGSIGMGSVAKLCNNMMLAISMIGTAETLNMAERLGLDAKLMTDILNISSGRTWVSEIYNPVPGVLETAPSSKNYNGGFKSGLIAKDLNLAQLISVESQSPTPMGSLASQYYRTLVNNGQGELDFSVVYKFLKQK